MNLIYILNPDDVLCLDAKSENVFLMENNNQRTQKVTQQILDWCVVATLVA